jgi:hypothetical protein
VQSLLARRKPLLSQELQHYPNATMAAFEAPCTTRGFLFGDVDTNQTAINTTDESQP